MRRRNGWLLAWVASLFCVANFFCFAGNLFAQSDIADAARLGFNVETLAEINELMSAAIDDKKMVGCNAIILKDDQSVE